MIRAAIAALVTGVVSSCGGAADRLDPRDRLARDPGDVAALLATAEQKERAEPASALAALEAAERGAGMLGPKLRDDDRARLGRLLLRRAEARVARGAASAATDLAKAERLGAKAGPLRAQAKVIWALAELRSADESRHAAALAAMAEVHAQAGDLRAVLAGARPGASPKERGALGRWLWQRGARLAALRALTAWREAADRDAAQLDDALVEAYLEARAWWIPSWRGDGPAPRPAHHRGTRRCAGVAPAHAAQLDCDVTALRGDGPSPSAAEIDLLRAPAGAAPSATQAAAWARLLARATLAGAFEDWRAAVIARLGGAASHQGWPSEALELLSVAARDDVSGDELARALSAASGLSVDASCAAAPCARLRSLTAAPAQLLSALPRRADGAVDLLGVLDLARARAAVTMAGGADLADLAELGAIAKLARADLPRARKRLDERAARATDAALAQAQAAALLDGLGDPRGARVRWETALAQSQEPAFLAGLAQALAHGGDDPAAALAMVAAAAASGDPAPVLVRVGRASLRGGRSLAALDAAKAALELASAETAPGAWALAREAAEQLQRRDVLEALEALRPALAPGMWRAAPVAATPAAIDGAWLASRLAPKSLADRRALLHALPAGDPRVAVVLAELLALCDDLAMAGDAVFTLAAYVKDTRAR